MSEGGVVVDEDLFQSRNEAWNGGSTGVGARKECIGKLTYSKRRILIRWNEVKSRPRDMGFLCTWEQERSWV